MSWLHYSHGGIMEVLGFCGIAVIFMIGHQCVEALDRIHATLRSIEHHVRRIPLDPADGDWG